MLLAAVSCAVVGRAFRKVDRAGEAISRRGPFDLAPLPSAGMPGELRPFIHSINQLLLRVKGGMDRERRFLEDAAHEAANPMPRSARMPSWWSAAWAAATRRPSVEAAPGVPSAPRACRSIAGPGPHGCLERKRGRARAH